MASNPLGSEHPIVPHKLVRVLEWLQLHRGPDYDRRKLFVERVAVIISKTYAECGDAAELADDAAIMLIRDLLLDFDEEVISRNKRIRRVRAHLQMSNRKTSNREEPK